MNVDTTRPRVREASAGDAAWFIEHVGRLIAEPDSQTPLRPEEFVVTRDEQAALFSRAAEYGDLFLVAEVAGERVGELNLRRGRRAAIKHSVLLGISVAREWRNRHIGSALIQRAIEWSHAAGDVRRIELYVYATHGPAIRLYERHGFVVEGRRQGAIRVEDHFVDDLFMVYRVCE